MIGVWSEYEEKINDIELYFSYLRANDSNDEIMKIQRANVFLMLYNLIESTVNNALEEIHSAINRENIKFGDCIDEIKALWVDFYYKKFKEKNSKDIVDKITMIYDDIILIPYDEYQKNKPSGVSGNLDAQKIRDILKVYCLDKNTRVEGRKLLEIKTNRNRLAHGEISFSELGKDYTISDIGKFCKECKLFLREFLQNVEKYIRDRKYKRI